ncbi:MAG: MAPEG family protein [Hyphomicrobiales bacterium]
MSQDSFRNPPDDAGMARAQRTIRRNGLLALLAVPAAAALGILVLPRLVEFPTDLADRLAFALQASVLVLFWVAVGVLMVSTARMSSPRDIGGSAAGPPSERLAVRIAFLQNTLEQAVLAAGLYVALATLLSGDWLSLIVVGVVFFGAGRVLFLRGYAKGVDGRSLGMSLTMMPTLLGYALALVLIFLRALNIS